MKGISLKLKSKSLYELVYRYVKQVPRGKVATYGQVASMISQTQNSKFKTRKKITPRMVGMVLHKNPNPNSIPCHRIIKSDGSLALGYAFGGRSAQRKILIKEGIKFKNRYIVDISRCLYELG